jgi:hypothetical protein
MAAPLGTVHTYVSGLLREWWWQVDSKLVFDQMAAPEIMDSSMYIAIRNLTQLCHCLSVSVLLIITFKYSHQHSNVNILTRWQLYKLWQYKGSWHLVYSTPSPNYVALWIHNIVVQVLKGTSKSTKYETVIIRNVFPTREMWAYCRLGCSWFHRKVVKYPLSQPKRS